LLSFFGLTPDILVDPAIGFISLPFPTLMPAGKGHKGLKFGGFTPGRRSLLNRDVRNRAITIGANAFLGWLEDD
jgi:hypothetical protein